MPARRYRVPTSSLSPTAAPRAVTGRRWGVPTPARDVPVHLEDVQIDLQEVSIELQVVPIELQQVPIELQPVSASLAGRADALDRVSVAIA